MNGLEELDDSPLALAFHRHYRTDLTPKLMRRKTWAWVRGRCYSLIDLDPIVRRMVTDGGI